MPLSVMNAGVASARDNGLAEYGWAGSGHARELAQPLDFGVIVVNPADLPHVDMRR